MNRILSLSPSVTSVNLTLLLISLLRDLGFILLVPGVNSNPLVTMNEIKNLNMEHLGTEIKVPIQDNVR